MSFEPLYRRLWPTPDPEQVFRRLAGLGGCVWLDSAEQASGLGRYSYLAADPYEWHTSGPADGQGWDWLARAAREASACRGAGSADELPPFRGGVVGMMGYEIGRSLERVPPARFDEFGAPGLAAGLYDVAVVYDHQRSAAWLVSQGLPETEPTTRRRRAAERMREFLTRLHAPAHPRTCTPRRSVPIERLAPQHPVPDRPGLLSDFSRHGYIAAVGDAIELIHAGDLFQVNLSQRLLARAEEDAAEAYLRLRRRNPAPFGGYFDLGPAQLLSASPERFLSVRDRWVETRPIKGTRRRSADVVRDGKLAAGLVASAKDRSENVMIVDLMRNDLSRVCEPASVTVPRLCGLETYRHVHHLVSVVRGRLSEPSTPVDLLRAAMPGGSITGAPKVRAMEAIAALEPTARGPYCGSLFWLSGSGAMDSSILIRTLVVAGGWVQASVGGGVVADSNPQQEYEETWAKAAGLF